MQVETTQIWYLLNKFSGKIMVTAHAGKDEGETETHQHKYWSGLIHSGLSKNNLALYFKHTHFHTFS